MTPIQAAPTWAMGSVAQTVNDVSYGMTFGETENIIYNFGTQGGQYIISRINGVTGYVIWTQAYTQANPRS